MIPDTEIICPNGRTTLIKFAKLEDVKQGIINALEEKKRNKTTENYTVIKFPDGRSMRLEKEPPEDVVGCMLRQSEYRRIESKYIY